MPQFYCGGCCSMHGVGLSCADAKIKMATPSRPMHNGRALRVNMHRKPHKQ